MSPPRPKTPEISPQQVEALLREADALCKESAEVREQARDGLITHFQQETGMQPIPSDQARRARMSRKPR